MLGGKHNPDAAESLTHILNFRCLEDAPDSCHWHQLERQLKYPRHSFVALRIPAELTSCVAIKPSDNFCFHEYLFFVDDGFCDDLLNTASCQFDGGDCCSNLISDHFCQECICHEDNSKHDVITLTTALKVGKTCSLPALIGKA